RVLDPVGVRDLGKGWALRRQERPVRLVFRAGLDPLPQALLLFRRERLLCVRRRHDVVRIRREDPSDQRALAGLAGSDRALLDRIVAAIEPEAGLARGAVRAVTGEAVLGEDGANVAVVG